MIKLFTFNLSVLLLSLLLTLPSLSAAGDLDEVLKTGKLRHLGIVYANFIIKDHKGLEVELMQKFAEHLGVSYEFVASGWSNIITDLTGKAVQSDGEQITILSENQPIRGDVIATGFTVLPWREKIVDFSPMTFPSGVWLIAHAESSLKPILPTGDIDEDVKIVKSNLNGVSILGLKNSCLDPNLYGLSETGAKIEIFPADRKLEEMIPAVVARLTEATLMNVPVALVALESWPGEIKVVGPVSPRQKMASAFAKTSPKLRQAFEQFFQQLKTSGQYKKLVEKYYPSLFIYYPDF